MKILFVTIVCVMADVLVQSQGLSDSVVRTVGYPKENKELVIKMVYLLRFNEVL